MGRIEQYVLIGSRWVLVRKLAQAIISHVDDKGKINRVDFKRIAFRKWYCLLEFEHDEE